METIEALKEELPKLLNKEEDLKTVIANDLMKWKFEEVRICVAGHKNIHHHSRELVKTILSVQQITGDVMFNSSHASLKFSLMEFTKHVSNYEHFDGVIMVTLDDFRMETNSVLTQLSKDTVLVLVRACFNQIINNEKKINPSCNVQNIIDLSKPKTFAFLFKNKKHFYNKLFMLDCSNSKTLQFGDMLDYILYNLHEEKRHIMAMSLSTPFTKYLAKCIKGVFSRRMWKVALRAVAISSKLKCELGTVGDIYVIVEEVDKYVRHLGINQFPKELVEDKIASDLLDPKTESMEKLIKGMKKPYPEKYQQGSITELMTILDGLKEVDHKTFINTYMVLGAILHTLYDALLQIHVSNEAIT